MGEVSSAVQGELWRAGSTEWATRLIPGSAHARGGRKGPRAVDVDGGARAMEKAASWQERTSASLGELVLPNPISVGGGWQLGLDIVGDTVATIATWALVAGAAAAHARGGVAPPTVEIFAQIIRSAGFALVFAALVTLLGYSEGIYQPGLPGTGMRAERTLAKSVAFATLIAGVGGT